MPIITPRGFGIVVDGADRRFRAGDVVPDEVAARVAWLAGATDGVDEPPAATPPGPDDNDPGDGNDAADDREHDDAQADGDASVTAAELSSMTKPELVALAEDRGIDLPDRITKADLIGLLDGRVS